MKKPTVSYEIIKYLESHPAGEWGGNLEDYIRAVLGSKGDTTGRALRKMVEEDLIKKDMRSPRPGQREVNYYWLPVKQKVLPQFAREVVSA
jgi:transcription initiation factor IIE alpha subunit